ncbi:hypothetical protein DUI87_09403 [Hirundo rustica rustica]|uniref:Uncharacterized protein n=1 Tax=Hirundo rustica rustica TaxID=333673 RepID=A0A3M0KU65_HIRRU|nr:hypothetical protein DUI87_09403 [Hirundo rustica rustica]
MGQTPFTDSESMPEAAEQELDFVDAKKPDDFLKSGSGEGGADLLSLVSSDKTHGNGSKLNQDIQRIMGVYSKVSCVLLTYLFSRIPLSHGRILEDLQMSQKNQVVRYWHRLSREAVDAPFLEAFEDRLNGALNTLV